MEIEYSEKLIKYMNKKDMFDILVSTYQPKG